MFKSEFQHILEEVDAENGRLATRIEELDGLLAHEHAGHDLAKQQRNESRRNGKCWLRNGINMPSGLADPKARLQKSVLPERT